MPAPLFHTPRASSFKITGPFRSDLTNVTVTMTMVATCICDDGKYIRAICPYVLPLGEEYTPDLRELQSDSALADVLERAAKLGYLSDPQDPVVKAFHSRHW